MYPSKIHSPSRPGRNATKRFLTILFAVTACYSWLHGQVSSSVTFDSSTGNYVIRFQGAEGIVETVFEPSTKVRPHIQCVVLRDRDSGRLLYYYTVRNGNGARQRLITFSVDHKTQINDLEAPNHQWTADIIGTRRLASWSHSRVDPHGVLTSFNGIPSDSAASGFSFRSAGLPTIVFSYSEGAAKTVYFPEEPPLDVDSLLDPLEIFPRNSVSQTTVGPKQPEEAFDKTAFLDTLLSYTRQSAQLGWLGRIRDDDCDDDERPDDGVVRNIENRLQKARRELVRGDSVKARRELEKLIRKVDRLQRRGERVMTGEAYALLKYNTEYLIERLPERRRR